MILSTMNEDIMSNRFSEGYMFTLPTNEIDTSDMLKQVRYRAKELNKSQVFDPAKGYKVRYRVLLRGRLGKNNPNAYLYARGGKLYRLSSQDIKIEHSTRVDVYLRKVRVYA